jgi:hypothetical protein
MNTTSRLISASGSTSSSTVRRLPFGFRPAAVLLLMGLVLLPLLVLTTSCSLPTLTNSRSSTDLQAALTFSVTNIMIDNGNDFVWNGVTLRLNNNYDLTIDRMPRGVTSVQLAEFRNAEGIPFNPLSMTPHQLNIQVQAGFENKPGSFNW